MKQPMEARSRFTLWYLLTAFLAFAVLQSVLTARHRETLPYSEFRAVLGAGNVRTAGYPES